MGKNLKKNITVVGSGYVGMSLAILLAQENSVTVLDINSTHVDKINNKESTVLDSDIDKFFTKKGIDIYATLDKFEAYKNADFIIIATPTNYNPENNKFDVSSVNGAVADAITLNKHALIVIKSTVPIGYTDTLQKKHNTPRVIFSPEFLREGKALFDNLYPSRIVIGGKENIANEFAEIILNAAHKDNVKLLYMPPTEAEALKLFSNTYLAMRVAFFNELDTYAFKNKLDTKSIIDGVCLDPRIGDGYNNPSFGYGGYCLPKDTKQLLANFNNTPQELIQAVVLSNSTRMDFIAEEILKSNPKTIGFYRLVMKKGSDNFRSSASLSIMDRLIDSGKKVVIYEPLLSNRHFNESDVISDINDFKNISDVIVANRITKELDDVGAKCFTRDIFNKD